MAQASFRRSTPDRAAFNVDYRMDAPEEIAAVLRAKTQMGLSGGELIANPIPKEYSMDKAYIDAKIDEAVSDAKEKGIKGKEITPFLLDRIQQITNGDSLFSNIQLVKNNAELAAKIAAAYVK